VPPHAGVSIATNVLPSSSNCTSTLSRVVPGISLTIIRSALASVLTKVLLPTFRRPTIATFIFGSSGCFSNITFIGSLRKISPSRSSLLRFCSVLTFTSFRPNL
jgi:hypothetical protein